MKKPSVFLCAIVLVFGITGSVNAALFDRGGGLIYDDYLDVTWLQDACYAGTSGAYTGGWMWWDEALDWASDLVYYDSVRNTYWSSWRLSDAYNQDGTGPTYGVNTDSEMGHLCNIDGINTVITGPFINVQDNYWTSTAISKINVWYFEFNPGGMMSIANIYSQRQAWAVMDGDVEPAAVPIPQAVWLMASGLLGLLGMGYKSKK